MAFQTLVFLGGLVVLYFGADWLVRAASSIALRFGIRPMVIGLTVVALGTSMPEFLLNFFAVITGEDALAIGNILGSNIANIALILGISSVLLPLAVDRNTLRKEYPMMVFATLLFYLLASDGSVSRIDGGILVLGLLCFLVFLVIDARNHSRARRRSAELLRQNGTSQDVDALGPAGTYAGSEATGTDRDGAETAADLDVASPALSPWKRAGLLLGGMIALSLGARLMVESAVEIAWMLDIHPVVIGLTIVAIGTSLPEMAASVMCAMRKESDMSIGNIMGSNMLNILFVVGLVSIIQPMTVEPISISRHFPVMIGFTLVLWPIARRGYTVSRIEGGILLAGFLGYLLWLLLPYV